IDPPQPLQRCNDEVTVVFALAGELDGIGRGIQRLHGRRVVRCGVRVPVAVDGEESHRWDVDHDELVGRRRVELLLGLLNIEQTHDMAPPAYVSTWACRSSRLAATRSKASSVRGGSPSG